MIITFNLPLNLSPDADHFVATCQSYAQIDPISIDYHKYGIEFTDAASYSDSYDEAGHDSSTFTPLMGGFVTLYIFLNVAYIVQRASLSLSRRYAKNRCCRLLGKS